jgi:exopolysaccharide production protein ExoQ
MATLRKRRWVRWAVGYLLLCEIQAVSIVDRSLYGEWLGKPGDKVTEFIITLQIVTSIVLFYRGFRYWPIHQKGGVLSISLAIFGLCSAVWLVSSEATLRGNAQHFIYYHWRDWPLPTMTLFTVFAMAIQLIVLGIVLFYRGFRYWPSLQRGGVLSICLAIFVLCSAVWSVDFGATLRLGIQYLFLIIGAIGVAENLEADEFMDLLAWVCFLSAIASLVLLIVSPANAFGLAGDFRGIFSQKNILGMAMSMGALGSLHRLRVGKRSRLLSITMLSVISFVALKSGSATSCSAIFLFCCLGMAIPLLQKPGTSRILAITGIIFLLPVVLVAVFNWNSLLETFGKDPTLTGRTEIWGYVIPEIYQRPILGWGYAAFWSTANPESFKIANVLIWFAPEAHNGILEILLSVGLIGAVFFIYLWGRTVRLSLKCMRTSESAMGISSFLSCAGVVLAGVSETVLLYPQAITCVFFTTGLFCERAIATARRARALHDGSPIGTTGQHKFADLRFVRPRPHSAPI